MPNFSTGMHQIQFRRGLRLRPRWRSLQRSFRPRSWRGGGWLPLSKNPNPALGPSGLDLGCAVLKISSKILQNARRSCSVYNAFRCFSLFTGSSCLYPWVMRRTALRIKSSANKRLQSKKVYKSLQAVRFIILPVSRCQAEFYEICCIRASDSPATYGALQMCFGWLIDWYTTRNRRRNHENQILSQSV